MAARRVTDRLSLRELAEHMGTRTDRVSLQRLRRRLHRRQKISKTRFLFRDSNGPTSPVMVSLPALEQACPDMCDRRSQAVENLKVYVTRLDDQLADLRLRDRALASRIRGVIVRVSALEAVSSA